MKKYRVAIIGRSGKGNYGHGLDKVWKEIPQAEIVGIADENPAGLKRTAESLGVKSRYIDYHKMLQAERPDIVSVAPRWLDCHHDMVLACAEQGASIFLEKPMCRTLAEADAMVRACEEKHVKLAIAHQTRYSPRIKTVQDLIAEGKIGRLLERLQGDRVGLVIFGGGAFVRFPLTRDVRAAREIVDALRPGEGFVPAGTDISAAIQLPWAGGLAECQSVGINCYISFETGSYNQ